MSEKQQFVSIDDGLDFSIKHIESGEVFYDCDSVVDLLNDQQDEIQQLKEELQISEESLALLIDMILLGYIDELVKRTKECGRQFAEHFDELIKGELEDAIKENPRLRELIDDE